MQPINLEFDTCGTQKGEEYLNKGTQTTKAIIIVDSKSSIQDNKPSSNQDSINSDKVSVTLFEFCQILQDPDSPKSVTIIKESVSEEVQNHLSKQSSEKGVANRFKYCKEVIEPYIQSDTPNSPPSKETLIKEILESVRQDFPDYQHCLQNFGTESIIKSKESGKVDEVTPLDSEPPKKMEEADNTYTKVEQRPGCFPTDVHTPSGIPDPGCDIKPKKSVNSVESEEKLSKTKTGCPQKTKPIPLKICDPTCEAECAGHHVENNKSTSRISDAECPPPIDYCTKSKAKQSDECIGNKGRKTSEEIFGITKPVPPQRGAPVTVKKENAPVPSNSDTEQVSKTECSSGSSIKTAMEDFITKVCSTTSETLSLIRKGNVRESPYSPCDEDENKEKESEDSSKAFNFFRKVDSQSKDGDDTYSYDDIVPGATMDEPLNDVTSEISNISDTINFNNISDPKSQSADDSLLKKQRSIPKDIANIIVPTNIPSHAIPVPQSSSVFATIKTKICSLFGDEKKIDIVSKSSTNCSQLDDEDGDIVERLIE